ncbi:MAG: GNAT family N-acetyltransferase [Bradymonadia bacterium]
MNLIETALAEISPQLRPWISHSDLHMALAAEFEHARRHTTDLDAATRFAALCPVPDTQPQNYLGQRLDLGTHEALVGIRFLGLDPNTPFVDVLATSFPLDDIDALRRCLRAACDAYAVFAPRRVRLRTGRAETETTLSAHFDVACDQRILAGPLEQLHATPKHPEAYRLTLRRCVDTAFYARFRATYTAFNAHHRPPDDPIHVSTEDDLRSVVARGHVYEAFIDDRWAGVVAADPSTLFGAEGFVVHEMLLDESFRGQGWGVALQQALIEQLAPEGGLLFGTIAASNTASLRTAQRVGRIDVGGWLFVEA